MRVERIVRFPARDARACPIAQRRKKKYRRGPIGRDRGRRAAKGKRETGRIAVTSNYTARFIIYRRQFLLPPEEPAASSGPTIEPWFVRPAREFVVDQFDRRRSPACLYPCNFLDAISPSPLCTRRNGKIEWFQANWCTPLTVNVYPSVSSCTWKIAGDYGKRSPLVRRVLRPICIARPNWKSICKVTLRGCRYFLWYFLQPSAL